MVKVKMKKMLEAKVIELSDSKFWNPLRIAIKNDGSQFDKTLTMYVDDYLIATRGSFSDHLDAICNIFTVLQLNNFTLKLDKSIFCEKKVNFLGFELSTDGIRPLSEKLDSISKFKKPKNRKELQSFIGVCTY